MCDISEIPMHNIGCRIDAIACKFFQKKNVQVLKKCHKQINNALITTAKSLGNVRLNHYTKWVHVPPFILKILNKQQTLSM
jgi:hypothetical protein